MQKFEIIPLEIGSLIERETYRKENKEIMCGTVWKFGSIITDIQPKFIGKYNPDIGVCVEDIPGAYIRSAQHPEKVIFFSETVDKDEKTELTDIFYGHTPKYSPNHEAVFEDLGWEKIQVESFIFGDLEVVVLSDL